MNKKFILTVCKCALYWTAEEGNVLSGQCKCLTEWNSSNHISIIASDVGNKILFTVTMVTILTMRNIFHLALGYS